METTDLSWHLWSTEQYSPICPSYQCSNVFGSSREPESSLWCASLLEPARKAGLLDRRFTILDWGCGDGRLFDFLHRRFETFRYCGVEQPNDFGASCVRRAIASFGKDPRASFDAIGTAMCAEAIEKAEIIVLGSIATHLPMARTEEIFSGFAPALERGAAVVGSFFIGPEYRLVGPGFYGHPECYGITVYTQAQVNELAVKMNAGVSEEETFPTNEGIQRIFMFRRCPRGPTG